MRPTDQASALRAMGFAGRWRVATLLYWQAREWKASALRALHPDWPEHRIRQAVREAFLHGRTA